MFKISVVRNREAIPKMETEHLGDVVGYVLANYKEEKVMNVNFIHPYSGYEMYVGITFSINEKRDNYRAKVRTLNANIITLDSTNVDALERLVDFTLCMMFGDV